MTQDWIPVGALGDAFAPDNNCLPPVADLGGKAVTLYFENCLPPVADLGGKAVTLYFENCLPPVADLGGKAVTLYFENGWVIRHEFVSDRQLTWTMLGEAANQISDTDQYVATRPRPNLYFVDFIKHSERATSVSLVLDFENGVFLAAVGQLPDRQEASTAMLDRIDQKLELTGVSCTIMRGTIDQEFSETSLLPGPTTDLIGKRIEYRYSKHENYEHIYLNDHSYTWHCLEGSERGLCDTDACHYYKIRENLYLFVWREKIVPTLGIVCIDLQSMKTTGKIFGYEKNDFSSLRNFGVGAFAKIISVLTR